ncbi:MAG TPA: cytochrome c biogenesis protein CcsA [Kofleriaceae bacterium]|nr:cytochrome c biogenesis protein CcsA [Kofleriaceae bacterium]
MISVALGAAGPPVMTTSVSPAFYVALVLYGLAAVLYVGFFTKAPAWVTRAAPLLLICAFIAHGVEIGWRGVEHVHPGTSVREALGFLSWLMVGGYLFASRKNKLGLLGAFVAPAGLVILAAARLSPTGDPNEGLSTLGRIHISLATIGVAIFSIATGLALVYLLEERSLKRKNFDGVLFRRGVALETLDRLAHRMVLVGFPIFTVALMLGVIWVSQRSSGFDRPEYPLAAITWASFAALIVSRTAWGWRGRKAAVLTIVGFSAAVIVFALYFARRAFG